MQARSEPGISTFDSSNTQRNNFSTADSSTILVRAETSAPRTVLLPITFSRDEQLAVRSQKSESRETLDVVMRSERGVRFV